ncbi:MAG: aminotransferase class III-fold pyridoxal phosphate-dependent enzyme [Clostridia bacterium]|nr:aminotransferase class III-fold pyridoxal phosphate-dependent enzyme [Clostridia bacterium]
MTKSNGKNISETQKLYNYAKTIIPGGTQLLSKRPEMMAPNYWPAYFKEANGCEVWDLDNKHYYDMSTNSVGACLLGYKDPDVTKAVIDRINKGSISTLNAPEDVYLADKLFEIHPWADMARFARTGGETASIAVRIARAAAGKSKVAISGYNGWHDWYIAANLGANESESGEILPGFSPDGVPVELRGTTIPFAQGGMGDQHPSVKDFDGMIAEHGGSLAAIVMEPCRGSDPEPGYLEHIREQTTKRGIVLIFDEISIGWRRNLGGSHLAFGVNPDIAIFSKALGNGHPIGAVIGTRAVMEAASEAFISSTYWTEAVGPVAALAAIDKHIKCNVSAHTRQIGIMLLDNLRDLGQAHNIPIHVNYGMPCLAHFEFEHELSQSLITLYIRLMLERGFLSGPSTYVTLAHTPEIVAKYAIAIDEVFGQIAKHLERGTVESTIGDDAAYFGFKRLL